jgi:uncharacterized membrane protein
MLTLAFIIAGALLGAALLHFDAGILVGALFGYLFARLREQGRRIEALQKRLDEAPAPPLPAPPVAASAPATPASAPPLPASEDAAIPSALDLDFDEPPSAVPPPLPPRAPPAPAGPTLIDKGLDWLRGGNPLARVGIVILFLGGAFLARYAAENAMFPLELRLAAIAAGALALLVTGWRLRERRAMYAQILQGGGIAGLYLTIFAAARLYHLLPTGAALGLMVVVALAGAVLAVAQNALPLAVIGFSGGFLAPVLLSTGSGNHIALFSYYTVLNLGVFTVAWFRAWRELNLVGFVFTFGITALWRASGYGPEDRLSADAFLLLFWALYLAMSVLFALRQPPKLKGYVSGTLVFGLPVIASGLHASLVREIDYAMAWSALGFGLVYIALAWALLRRGEALRLLAEAFAAIGVIFASLAVPLAFDERATALMWAVEGAGLMWLGLRQQRPLARLFSLLLQLAAGLRFLAHAGELRGELLLLNGAWMASAALAVAGLLSAWWLQRHRDALTRHEAALPLLMALWGSAWWFVGGLVELDRHAPQAWMLGMALAFIALGLLLLEWLGRRGDWPQARQIALFGMPLALLVSLVLAGPAHPLAEAGWLGWPLLLAVSWRLLWQLDRQDMAAAGFARAALHAAPAWTLAVAGAWELHWQLRLVPGIWRELPWGVVPLLLLGLCGASRLRPQWPLQRHAGVYRVVVALPLAIAVAIWTVALNLGSDGDPGWLPYIPVFNPLDLALALGLLSLAGWLLSLDTAQRARLGWSERWLPWGMIGALAFLTLSAALLRALHHGYGTPLDAGGIVRSTLVQASLSVFWSLLGVGAMLLATRRGWRALWMIGAALMGVVVAKLFLLDLSGSGTLARIASFLCVGLLLLLTGYLSPLPPAAAGTRNGTESSA